jgi:aryl-alcohol dehydrogenase-like predicted oxidoreductase
MAAPPPHTRIEEAEKQGWSESWRAYANEHTWQVIDTLMAVAAEVKKTEAQVALNWLLRRPTITAPILGARTMAHLQDNLGATGWSLTTEQITRLDTASALPLPYPYESLAQQRTGRGH